MQFIDLTNSISLDDDAFKDLDIIKLCRYFLPALNEEDIKTWMNKYLCCDKNEIIKRNYILNAFHKNSDAYDKLKNILSSVQRLEKYLNKLTFHKNKLFICTFSYKALKEYVFSVNALHDFLSELEDGTMDDIKKHTDYILSSEKFAETEKMVAAIEERYQPLDNITAGVNVLENGDAYHIGMININKAVDKTSDLFSLSDSEINSLFSDISFNRDAASLQLESLLLQMVKNKWTLKLGYIYKIVKDIDFNDINKWNEFIAPLEFYLAGLLFAGKMTDSGYSLCMPDFSSHGIVSKNLVYPHLAMDSKTEIVKTSTNIPENGTVIVTGANHSGKTSYIKSIAQNCLLGQLGFLLPADSFSFSPKKKFLTLFSSGEDENMNASRFQKEVRRLRDIIDNTDHETFVFFNEPFTSTSPREAAEISCDVLMKLNKKKAVQIMVTHIYDVYYMMKNRKQNDVLSFITTSALEDDIIKNYYEIEEREPDCLSFAQIIAEEYGASCENLLIDKNNIEAVNAFLSTL